MSSKRYLKLYQSYDEFLHEIKYALPDIAEVAKYIRRRNGCPSHKHFDRFQSRLENAINKAMEDLGGLDE